MTKVHRHFYSALSLLAILCISAAVSPAQRTTESGSTTTTTIDPFAVLPSADALMVVDLKRVINDAVPRILVNEPAARALVLALYDSKTIDLLDPRTIQRSVVAFRYGNSKDEKNPDDFDVVTVAQSSEAGQLPTLIHNRASGKYREQQYGGKVLYITPAEQKASTAPNADQTEWAIVALDANTMVFGSPTLVRL